MTKEEKYTGKVKVPLNKMKKVRKELKITQSRIAEFLGVTTQYFSLLERGTNTLSYSQALQIAKFFNTTTDYLFKEDFTNASNKLSELEKRGF